MEEAAFITLRSGSGQIRGAWVDLRTWGGGGLWRPAGRREKGRRAGLPKQGLLTDSFSLTTLFFRLNFRSPKTLPLKVVKHSQDVGT